MSSSPTLATDIDSASQLSGVARRSLRDLLLSLADNKRVLGIRYSDCMLGSPSLETGIAAASMAQDEWGHSRLTYAVLADFGDDPKGLEHERESADYHSMEPLDHPFASYVSMIAASLLIDGALTVQYQALTDSRYVPVRNRVQKLLDEEVLHTQFAVAWTHRLAKSRMLGEFRRELKRILAEVLLWFGPDQAEPSSGLVEAGVLADGADALRQRFLQRLGPVLEEASIAHELSLVYEESGWQYTGDLDWAGWSEDRRRRTAGGPDAETLARVRGDRNRSMLLD